MAQLLRDREMQSTIWRTVGEAAQSPPQTAAIARCRGVKVKSKLSGWYKAFGMIKYCCRESNIDITEELPRQERNGRATSAR